MQKMIYLTEEERNMLAAIAKASDDSDSGIIRRWIRSVYEAMHRDELVKSAEPVDDFNPT